MPEDRKIMYIFPGQGSQYKSIGSDLYERYANVRELYAKASALLGYDIADLSFNSSEEQITLTRHTQPVLLTHSIACLEVFKTMAGNTIVPAVTAGHSLGEYSALVAAGAMSFETALRLVQKRGEYMSEYGAGEMLALSLDLETARTLAEKHYCAVAGCNLRDQTVVGGLGGDLDALAADIAENYPRKRAVRLKTEGAFHTYYMVAAAQHYRSQLDAADIVMDRDGIQVLSNYTGTYHQKDSANVKTGLFFQLFYPVQWLQNINTALADNIDTIIEFGGGIGSGETPAEKRPNLEGMVKKAQRGTDYNADYFAAINIETIAAAAERLQQV